MTQGWQWGGQNKGAASQTGQQRLSNLSLSEGAVHRQEGGERVGGLLTLSVHMNCLQSLLNEGSDAEAWGLVGRVDLTHSQKHL